MLRCHIGSKGALLLLNGPKGAMKLTIVGVGLLGEGIRFDKARRQRRRGGTNKKALVFCFIRFGFIDSGISLLSL